MQLCTYQNLNLQNLIKILLFSWISIVFSVTFLMLLFRRFLIIKYSYAGFELNGFWSWIATHLSCFAAEVSVLCLKSLYVFPVVKFSTYFKGTFVFSVLYNALFWFVSFFLLNTGNTTLDINIVICKQIYLLLCLSVSWHTSL